MDNLESLIGPWNQFNIVTDLGLNGVKTFYLPDTFKFFIVREVTLTRDSCDEQEAHYFDIKKPWLKKGTVLKVKYRWCNYYGTFYRCEHEYGTYDINAANCKVGPLCIGEFIGLLPDNYGEGYWDRKDWDPRAEGYKEINMEEYIKNVKNHYIKRKMNPFEILFTNPFDYTDFDTQLEKISKENTNSFIKKLFKKIFSKKDKCK